MDLEELAKHWDKFGRDDPLWAVLTAAEKRDGGWDVDEFLKTGQEQVDTALKFLADHDVEVPRDRALDFGCGPGRLTQALAHHFTSVDGVDIAPSMIALAREWNQHGDRCSYHVNERSDLSIFDDNAFTFIFTILVMQHMEPRFQAKYMREFARCLAPGGYAFFQVVMEHPRVGAPLPDDAFRAHVAFDAPKGSLHTGSPVNVPVTVRNESSTEWPTMSQGGWYHVTVANRWLDAKGKVVIADDGRGLLPHDLAPGEEAQVVLTVNAPLEEGDYQLQIDLVQEGVSWFQHKGSQPAQASVHVEHRDVEKEPETFHARMEMHTVTVDECRSALRAGGAEIVTTYPYADVFGEPDPHFDSRFILAKKAAPRRKLFRRG